MSRQKFQQGVAAAAVFIFMWGAVQAAAGFWVFEKVKKRAKVKIEGQYFPDLFLPSFRVEGARLVYMDRFEASAGRLKFRYNLVPLSPDLLHVWVEGDGGMKVRLLGKWAEVKGVEQEAPLERFKAELQLIPKGILLHAADIQSPVFQFQLKKSENFKGQLLS